MSRIEPLARVIVAVIVERRKAKSVWTDFTWRPVAVLAGEPDAVPWTALEGDADCMTFYAGPAEIQLYRSECGNYRTNLATNAPKLWVGLRATDSDPPVAVGAVTADPGEAEAMMESGIDLIEGLPMPEPVCATIAAFIEEHQIEDAVFVKRKPDRADPEALARRAVIRRRR